MSPEARCLRNIPPLHFPITFAGAATRFIGPMGLTRNGAIGVGKQRGEIMSVPAELLGLTLYATDAKLCQKWGEVYPLWQQTYKGINVLQEIRKAHAWEVTNPDKRKSLRVSFLNNWLSRAQTSQHRYEQDRASMKQVGRYIPSGKLYGTPNCARCHDTGLVPSEIVTRWKEKVPAMAKCPACALRSVAL